MRRFPRSNPGAPPLIGAALIALAMSAPGCEEPTSYAPGELVYEVGFNHVEGQLPGAFVPLSAGNSVPVVKGSQGAWMVVGAVRTNAFAPEIDKITVEAKLTDGEGKIYAHYRIRRPLYRYDDGLAYVTDLYLIVESAKVEYNFDWADQDAILLLELEADDGTTMTDQVTIKTTASD